MSRATPGAPAKCCDRRHHRAEFQEIERFQENKWFVNVNKLPLLEGISRKFFQISDKGLYLTGPQRAIVCVYSWRGR